MYIEIEDDIMLQTCNLNDYKYTIITSNDIVINFGVIVAGLLVYSLESNIPDLVIGLIVFVIVVNGAIRILKI